MASSLAMNRGMFEDFNVTWQDRRGRTLLHHAVLRNDIELVKDMLIAGTSVFTKDRVRRRVRACAGVTVSTFGLESWLMACVCCQVGATPLHLAVLLEGGDRIVDLLLSEGADFNEPKAVRRLAAPCRTPLDVCRLSFCFC